IAEPLHVELLAREREAMTLELREIEHFSDETLEPARLLGDYLERLGPDHRVLREPFPQRVDVPADRGQRRPQLVRHGHEEVALPLLRLRETLCHLAQPVGEMPDLTPAPYLGHLDVEAPRRDVVGDVRE